MHNSLSHVHVVRWKRERATGFKWNVCGTPCKICVSSIFKNPNQFGIEVYIRISTPSHSTTCTSQMIWFVVKWWSLWIWFRVGRTVRKYQAKRRQKKKKCNKLYRSDRSVCVGASETVNRILTLHIFFNVHFTCSFANGIQANSEQHFCIRTTANLRTIYCKKYISTHLSTISSAVRLYVVVNAVAVPCFVFHMFHLLPFFAWAVCALASSYYIVSERIGCAVTAWITLYIRYIRVMNVCVCGVSVTGPERNTDACRCGGMRACMYTTTVCYVWHGVLP